MRIYRYLNVVYRIKIGKGVNRSAVVLDDCNFHECVNTMEFDGNRTLKIHPPDGEFIAMNYRITSDFEPPFRVVPVIEEISAYKLELTLKVKANFPK
jgi:AP-4 complex subunit mu-1